MSNKKSFDWKKISKKEHGWEARRKLNYPELSLDDIGILYDIVSEMLSALDKNNVKVKLSDGDMAKLNHRNLVKERIPKGGK